MDNISNLARRVRGLANSDLSNEDFEYVFSMLLEEALNEAFEDQPTVKSPSRLPAPDSELGRVLAIVKKGVSNIGEITKTHLGEDNSKNRMATSSRLSTLAKRGFVVRKDRGEYEVTELVKQSVEPVQTQTGFDVIAVEPVTE